MAILTTSSLAATAQAAQATQDESHNYREFQFTNHPQTSARPADAQNQTQPPILQQKFVVASMNHPSFWADLPELTQSAQALKAKNITDLISLEETGLSNLNPQLDSLGIKHKAFSVKDYTAPSMQQLKEIFDYIDLRLTQTTDFKLGIHCMGGNGRTGTVLAALYLKLLSKQRKLMIDVKKSPMANVGVDSDKVKVPAYPEVVEAIKFVRSKDFKKDASIETQSQVVFLNQYFESLTR